MVTASPVRLYGPEGRWPIRLASRGRLTRDEFMGKFREFLGKHNPRGIRAFFTMEIYDGDGRPGGGGLGTLSADWLQESADRGLPVMGISIAHSRLHHQRFDGSHWQHDDFVDAKLDDNPNIVKLGMLVRVNIQGKDIACDVYGKLIEGRNGEIVPILLLNADRAEQTGFNIITHKVYPGQKKWFETLAQEMILGFGGVKLLSQLGVNVAKYHLNDGHPAFAAVQVLLDMGVRPDNLNHTALKELREKIIYTSHTLVGAAADKFFPNDLNNMIQDDDARRLVGILGAQPIDGQLKPANHPYVMEGTLDMAGMCMMAAGRINGVSRLNADLLTKANPQHEARIIGGITNAVHPDWVPPALAELFDRTFAGWRADGSLLARIAELRTDTEFRRAVYDAKMEAKLAAIKMVAESREKMEAAGLGGFYQELSPDWFTIGFARRAAVYKRHDLFAHDRETFIASVPKDRPVQIIMAGKAHYMDEEESEGGKANLRKVLDAGKNLNNRCPDRIRFVFLPNYDVGIARKLISGVDLWLNNPIWGEEASGTSPEDAAVAGTLIASTVDGCIVEMEELGDFGWGFGRRRKPAPGDQNSYMADAYALYGALSAAAEVFYRGLANGMSRGDKSLWLDKQMSLLEKIAPFVLTGRMVGEYAAKMWDL